MRDVIPEAILQRVKEFAVQGKTGQIVLNVYSGDIISANITEHVKATRQKIVDRCPSAD